MINEHSSRHLNSLVFSILLTSSLIATAPSGPIMAGTAALPDSVTNAVSEGARAMGVAAPQVVPSNEVPAPRATAALGQTAAPLISETHRDNIYRTIEAIGAEHKLASIFSAPLGLENAHGRQLTVTCTRGIIVIMRPPEAEYVFLMAQNPIGMYVFQVNAKTFRLIKASAKKSGESVAILMSDADAEEGLLQQIPYWEQVADMSVEKVNQVVRN